MKGLVSILLILAFTDVLGPTPSFGQSNPTFLQLGQAKGALYKPDSGPEIIGTSNRIDQKPSDRGCFRTEQ